MDGPPTKAMRAMWRAAGYEEGLGQSDMVAGGIPFCPHPVCHSAFGTMGTELLTAQGGAFFSADLRRHGSMGDRTEAFVAHVVACVGANRVEPLGAFLAAAMDSRRRLVVSPRTMLLEAVGAADPFYDMSGRAALEVHDGLSCSRNGWHRDLRERRHAQLVSPEEIAV